MPVFKPQVTVVVLKPLLHMEPRPLLRRSSEGLPKAAGRLSCCDAALLLVGMTCRGICHAAFAHTEAVLVNLTAVLQQGRSCIALLDIDG